MGREQRDLGTSAGEFSKTQRSRKTCLSRTKGFILFGVFQKNKNSRKIRQKIKKLNKTKKYVKQKQTENLLGRAQGMLLHNIF